MKQLDIQNIITKLQTETLNTKKIFVGFDGFIDEILHVVDKRIDDVSFSVIPTIKEYGNRIIRSSGLSTNFELVTVQRKFGGNGPILANSLSNCGCQVVYAGAVGNGQIHPIFSLMSERCELIGICDPAHTEAIEFQDGKIICSKLANLNNVTWDRLLEKIGIEKIEELILSSDLVGFENWTMLLHMTDIWQHIIDNLLIGYEKKLKEKIFFVDLADPEKRDEKDIRRAIEIIGDFANYFTVVLGLNKKEVCEIAEIFGLKIVDFSSVDTVEVMEFLMQKIHVDKLVVHLVDMAYVAEGARIEKVRGPYCSNPKLTTGAGDNFNAGYVMGELLGCTNRECLLLGVANSGFYVRNAKSANKEELMDFMEKWNLGKIEE